MATVVFCRLNCARCDLFLFFRFLESYLRKVTMNDFICALLRKQIGEKL